MTNDERIEAAARVLCIHDWDALPEEADQMNGWGTVTAGKAFWRFKARKALSAAYPELHPPAGQQPTHWLAPWEADDQMYGAALQFSLDRMKQFGVDGLSPFKDYPPLRETTTGMFAAMRNTHLSK